MDNQLRAIILKLQNRLSEDDRIRLHFFFGNYAPKTITTDLTLRGTLNLMDYLFEQDKIDEQNFTFLINAFDEIQCNDASKLLREHLKRIQSDGLNQSMESLSWIMPSKINELLEDQDDDKHAMSTYPLVNQLNTCGNNNVITNSTNTNINQISMVIGNKKVLNSGAKRKQTFNVPVVWICLLLFILLSIIAHGIIIFLYVRNIIDFNQLKTNNSQSIEIIQQLKINNSQFIEKIHRLRQCDEEGVSVNRPKLSACASWNPSGITFANSATIGSNPGTVFVDRNDAIYVTDRTSNRVQVWQKGSSNITRTVFGGLNDPLGLFVSNNGDIYVDNGYVNNQINRWAINSTTSVVITHFSGGRCYGLFIDINHTLYCSLKIHQVIKISLNNIGNMTQLAAGTGSAGSTPYMLNWPRGIFINTNWDLYVADGNNNRIQKFRYGELNGITMAGAQAPGTISLNGPSSVVLDADGYLFIVDQNNHRIIGSGPNGYRCLFGCSEQAGSTSSQLNLPYSMSFDSYGNIYVTDKENGRVQMFVLARNPSSCGKCYEVLTQCIFSC